MDAITIFHNPKCSKSRQTLEIIQKAGVEPKIVKYLEETPDATFLEHALAVLGAETMLRKGEDVYKNHIKGKNLTHTELARLMVEHPKLIERPLVVKGDEMVMGRPPESVQRLLD